VRRVLIAVLTALMAVGTLAVALVLNGNSHSLGWRLVCLTVFILWEAFVFWLALLVYDNFSRRGVHRR
jgi:hypothetical protein